jgi:hypothetical protein
MLELTPNQDGRTWTVDEDCDCDGVIVPKGFVTDLASIPQCFWNILPPFGKYTPDAVGHDYRYRYHIGTRKEADDRFLEGMKRNGVGWLIRNTIYWNVRAFGWNAWNNEKELRAKPY